MLESFFNWCISGVSRYISQPHKIHLREIFFTLFSTLILERDLRVKGCLNLGKLWTHSVVHIYLPVNLTIHTHRKKIHQGNTFLVLFFLVLLCFNGKASQPVDKYVFGSTFWTEWKWTWSEVTGKSSNTFT